MGLGPIDGRKSGTSGSKAICHWSNFLALSSWAWILSASEILTELRRDDSGPWATWVWTVSVHFTVDLVAVVLAQGPRLVESGCSTGYGGQPVKLSSDFLLCRGVGSLNPHFVQRSTVFNNSLAEFKAWTMAVSPRINGLHFQRSFQSFFNGFWIWFYYSVSSMDTETVDSFCILFALNRGHRAWGKYVK